MPKKSSVFLTELAQLPLGNQVTLGEISDRLTGKGPIFLALIRVLPFIQPIPLPGLSSFLGLLIALQGVAVATLGRPLLTKKMRQWQLPPDKFASFVRGAEKIFGLIGWMIQARGQSFTQLRIVRILTGFCLIFLALFLSLPLPIPWSNFIPALGIFFICLGYLEEDLVLLMIGLSYALVFAWLLYFAFGTLWAEMRQSGGWFTFITGG